MTGYDVLTPDDAEHFLAKGYVVLRGCFSRAAAAEFSAGIWARLGYHEHDQSTWTEPSVHMPVRRKLDVREFAPKVWGAVCDLVGGAERIATDRPYVWDDAFIVNLWQGADRPWEPASPAASGWHKDGDFFRHYLDSPEQGLLTLVLWSDVRHQGGATFVATDSVAPVARFLADHPQGTYPADSPSRPDDVPVIPYADLAAECGEFFDRADPDDFSLVERAVLRALGVPRYEFAPAGPREALVPPRIARQRQMLADEERRLVA